MLLTPEQIAAIAKWEPAQAGFGRDEPKTRIRIQAIVDRLNSSGDLRCKIVSDDGLSNYFAVFSYRIIDVQDVSGGSEVKGLLAYLSACFPVGVVGRSRRSFSPRFEGHNTFDMNGLIDPTQPQDALEEKTFEAIRLGGYELWSAEEVSLPLPPGVKPFEYCHGPEPWDRVFHALFADTD